MMYLKQYQHKVVAEFKNFLDAAKREYETWLNTPEKYRLKINWINEVFEKTYKFYKDQCKTGLHEPYPRIVIKVPTGGGKTLLAVEAIRDYQSIFACRRTGLVVWIVPSDTIYTQTISKLRDKTNPLRQLLDQSSGNHTLIMEKGQKISREELDENLVILFIMIQSVNRKNGREALKVFQDSGGYDDFFPNEQRLDLHKALVDQCPNLDLVSEIGPIVSTSLGNLIRLSRPLVIIDEIHKVFSDTARSTIDNLNPLFVLGLTATPARTMNILFSVSGLELKQEEMVKLDMHIIPPGSRQENDWQLMLQEIVVHRQKLEKRAIAYKQNTGIYIRPIALIQVERTGKDQRGKGFVHSQDVKEYLQTLKINPEEIAIKSSAQNDIEDVNLFSPDCEIRYIITKEALREGWDCSFAYLLGIIPNVNSNTAVTQLVGRILRQPNAQKTGVAALDESYVYFTKGNTEHILKNVDTGFRKEGLEDLIAGVTVDGSPGETKPKVVHIRKEFKKDYVSSFYLPVWVMVHTGDNPDEKRKFSYEYDIKPYLDYTSLKVNKSFIEKMQSTFSAETSDRKTVVVGLNAESRLEYVDKTVKIEIKNELNTGYLTRRYAETVGNAFLARKLADSHLSALKKYIDQNELAEKFGYITAYLCRHLENCKVACENMLFQDYLKEKKLVLAVSNNEELGFMIPEAETISIGRFPNPYKYYLFDDVDITAMNSFEQKVGQLLDKQEKIIWWFRNKVSRQWYSIQGWQENKIHPDFVAAKKKDNGKLELVYVLESKGAHLLESPDARYKREVFEIMTKQKKNNAIAHYEQGEFDFGSANSQIEYYLVDQGKEDEQIGSLFRENQLPDE
jgi:type III restriction enzyme